MANVDMIDRYFYQGYAENGTDLMKRYGAGHYFWVRLGFIFPAQTFNHFFGAVPGFFAWRYLLVLLAIIPAYQLFRRLSGPAAGWVAVAAILANPVLITAWGTDYPDSSGVSYLICGTCCLFMPSQGPLPRLRWVLASGVALSLAAHSQAVCVPLLLTVVVVFAVAGRRDSVGRRGREVGLLALTSVGVTGLLAVAAKLRYNVGNVLAPTITEYQDLRRPAQQALWHSTNWHWVLRDSYLLVPVVAVAVWCVLAHRSAPRHTPAASRPARLREWAEDLSVQSALALIAAVQFSGYAAWQFWFDGSGLEYHFYSSMLWSSAVLVVAGDVVVLGAVLLERRWYSAVPALLVVAVPYALTFSRSHLIYTMTVGLPLAAAVVVTVAVARRASVTRHAGTAAVALTVTVLAGIGSLTIAKPFHDPLLNGQRPFPQAAYGYALRSPGWRATLNTYQLAARFNAAMPKAQRVGQDMLFWYRNGDDLSAALEGQFLWHLNALRDDLPQFSTFDLNALEQRRRAQLTMIAYDPARLGVALVSVRASGIHAVVVKKFTVHAGNLSRSVVILQLSGVPAVSYPAAAPLASRQRVAASRKID